MATYVAALLLKDGVDMRPDYPADFRDAMYDLATALYVRNTLDPNNPPKIRFRGVFRKDQTIYCIFTAARRLILPKGIDIYPIQSFESLFVSVYEKFGQEAVDNVDEDMIQMAEEGVAAVNSYDEATLTLDDDELPARIEEDGTVKENAEVIQEYMDDSVDGDSAIDLRPFA